MRLDDMLGLPQSGVIILFKDRSFLISYTTSMGASLDSIYKQFRGQTEITIKVVSAGADIETLKIHTEYYKDMYTGMGFATLQKGYRKAIQYRVRAIPNKDFKFVDVELVTARGDVSKVVGKFKTKAEAKLFIETYYGTVNQFKLPVYALNADTKAFILDNQTELLNLI